MYENGKNFIFLIQNFKEKYSRSFEHIYIVKKRVKLSILPEDISENSDLRF